MLSFSCNVGPSWRDAACSGGNEELMWPQELPGFDVDFSLFLHTRYILALHEKHHINKLGGAERKSKEEGERALPQKRSTSSAVMKCRNAECDISYP